eukprot:1154203-Pelagomonas_calceolata.AAC.7
MEGHKLTLEGIQHERVTNAALMPMEARAAGVLGLHGWLLRIMCRDVCEMCNPDLMCIGKSQVMQPGIEHHPCLRLIA